MSNFPNKFFCEFSVKGKLNENKSLSSKRYRCSKAVDRSKFSKLVTDNSVLYRYGNVKIDDDSDDDTESQKKIKVLNLIDGDSDDCCQETSGTINAIIDDEEPQEKTKCDWLHLEDNSNSSPIKKNSQPLSFTQMGMCDASSAQEFVKLINNELKIKQKTFLKQSVIHCEEPITLKSLKAVRNSSNLVKSSPSLAKNSKTQYFPIDIKNKCLPDPKLKNVLNKCANSESDDDNIRNKAKIIISNFTPPKEKKYCKDILKCVNDKKLQINSKIPDGNTFSESDNSCDSFKKTPHKESVILDFTPDKIESIDDSPKETAKCENKYKLTIPTLKLSTAVRKNIFSNSLDAESKDCFDNGEDFISASSVDSKNILINESTPEKASSFRQMLSHGVDTVQNEYNFKCTNIEGDSETPTKEEFNIFETSFVNRNCIDEIIDFESSPSVSNCYAIGCVQSPHKNDSSPTENDKSEVYVPGLTPKKSEVPFIESDKVFFSKNKKKLLKGGALVGRALAVISSYKVRNKVSVYELEVGLNDNITFSDSLCVQFSWIEKGNTYLKCSNRALEEIFIHSADIPSKGRSIPLPYTVVVIVANETKKISPGVEIKLSFPLKVFTYSKLNEFIAIANHIKVLKETNYNCLKNKFVSSNQSFHQSEYKLQDLFLTSVAPSPGYIILKNSNCTTLKEAHFAFPFFNNFSIEVSVLKIFNRGSSSLYLLTTDKENTYCIISLPVGVSEQRATLLVGKKGVFNEIVLKFIKFPVTPHDLVFQGVEIVKTIPTILYYTSPFGQSWNLNDNFLELNN